MAEQEKEFKDLEALFAAARTNAPPVSHALKARVLSDAAAEQAGFAAPARPVRVQDAGGWFRQLREAFGGWAGLGGLATACAAGVWIGFAPPASWPDPAMLMFQQESGVDLFHGDEMAFLLVEGG